jgi:hypothetical protein
MLRLGLCFRSWEARRVRLRCNNALGTFLVGIFREPTAIVVRTSGLNAMNNLSVFVDLACEAATSMYK